MIHIVYIVHDKNEEIVNAVASEVTKGFLYERPYEDPNKTFKEPILKTPSDFNKILLDIGFPQLDDIAKKILGEYASKGTTKPVGTSSAGSRSGDTDTTPDDKPEPEIDNKTKDAIDKIADKSAEIVQFADIVAKNKKK